MTHEYRARRFEVEALTRVEGEGGLIVEVRDGIEVGERVVIRGLETLADESRVRVSGNS